MSFKRSWSHRLAALLSAVMVMSSASPVAVPVMAAEDLIGNTQQEVTMDEDINAQVTEEGSTLASEEDMLSDTETITEPENGIAPVITDDLTVDETDGLAEATGPVEGSAPLIYEPDEGSEETYSGTLRFNTVSAGILRKIKYQLDDGTPQYIDLKSDGLQTPISFSNAKTITVFSPISSPEVGPNSFSTMWYGNFSDYGYYMSVGVSGYEKTVPTTDSVTFDIGNFNFKQGKELQIDVDTIINKPFRKKGNLVIHINSENRIPGTDKVISINKVNVQLGSYAISYDPATGNIVAGNYRSGAALPFVEVSENEIGVSGYNGTITVPYWCAKEAYIWIDDDYTYAGLDENYSRYAYTVQGMEFYNYNNSHAHDTYAPYKRGIIGLTEGIGVDTHVTVGVKQMTFEPTVKFAISANDIISSFKVWGDNGTGTHTEYTIDDLSDPEIKTLTFANTRKLVFDYSLFTPTSEAGTKYGTSDGLGKNNWVYRIEYKDTSGKDVSHSICTDDSGDYHKSCIIEADANGRFPENIKISAIPNVKVTLSANGVKQYKRSIGDIFKVVSWEDENGRKNSAQAVDENGQTYFFVEPGKTVSINFTGGNKSYIFPYIEGALPEYYGNERVLECTLPEITEDRVFDVSFREFELANKDVFKATNGTRNQDGKQGKANVSINGFDGDGVETDTDAESQLNNRKVFAAPWYSYGNAYYYYDFENQEYKYLDLKIKMDSTEAYEYSFDKISYYYYDHNDNTPIELRKCELSQLTEGSLGASNCTSFYDVSKDSQGNFIATVKISTDRVLNTLVKTGKFELIISEYERERPVSIKLAEGTPGTVKTASVQVGGEYKYALKKAGYQPEGELLNGTEVSLRAEPADGFGLSGVSFTYPADSSKNVTVSDAKKLAAFTGKEGYSYKMIEGVIVTFNTEPVYTASVRFKAGLDEPKLQNGKYSIDHKRPVLVQYRNGAASPATYTCDIYVGSEKITSNEGITKSGDIYTVDANKGNLAGKNVTFKFYTGDGSRTDKSLKTVVLAFDKADSGVKFAADKYSIPLGSEKEIPVNISGSFVAEAVLASDRAYDTTGLVYKLDASAKKLIIKSTANSKPDTYTINIVNPYDSSVVYGSVKIELETSTVKTAPAPVVQIIGTTNRGVTVGFRAQKIDTSIKGLFYELQVMTKDQQKGYFRLSRGVEAGDKIYVPVTTSSIYVDMFTPEAASGSEYAGDPDAVFFATARIIQLKTDEKTIVSASDNWSSEKDGTFGTKEGERYETRLRLKKISKGKIYNTMSSGNAYRIGVVYSKKTAIQRLDKTRLELLTESGGAVDYPAGKSIDDYLKIEDDYTILFHPGGLETKPLYPTELRLLAPGTYIIKAYALEPDGLEVSASIKVKVEKGIGELDLKDVSTVIYKKQGKAVNLQLTAMGKTEESIDHNGDVVFSEYTARKVRFEIVSDNTGGLVKISKSGKLAVNKKLEPDNSEIKVRVTADDFERAPGTEEVFAETSIRIRSLYGVGDLSLAHINTVDNTIKILENNYYFSELADFPVNQKDRWGYFPRFQIIVNEKNKDDKMNYYVPATFKVSGGGKLIKTDRTIFPDQNGTYGSCAEIEITDVDKDIKISAFAADGSGRKLKDYKVKILPAVGKLGVYIADGTNTENDTYIKQQEVLDWDWGNTNLTCDSYANIKDGMSMLICSKFFNERTVKNEYPAVKCRISSVKGGRVSKINLFQYRIYPTAAQTTFTVTDLTAKKDYKITINNKGYVDSSKKTNVTAINRSYDEKKGVKTVNGVIYSKLDFSSTDNYTDYDGVKWNTVTFHVDSAEDNQYVLVELVSVVKRVGGTYKVVSKPLGNCLNSLMAAQSEKEKAEGTYAGTFRSGAAYPIKLTGKDFTIDFFDVKTKKFDIAPGSYKLKITPVRREGLFRYRTLANTGTVSIKVVAAPKANVKPVSAITFGTSEGTVTKGDYSNVIASPIYKVQGIQYKALKNINTDGVMNGFATNFKITDNMTGKIEYIGNEPIGTNDKDRGLKLQGWLILEYQQVDGTVAEQPVKVKIDTKGEVKKK